MPSLCAFGLFDAARGTVCSGVDRSSSGTWRRGAKMPWANSPAFCPVCSGVGLQRGASARLPAVLSAQGRWVVALQFPPFLPAVGNFCPPPRLLRKLLALSPQVIFHHVALKSWALLGAERDPLTPSYLWRGDPETSSMSRRGQPFPGGHRSTGTWWPNASVGGGSEISDCRAMKVTSYFLQRVR